MSHLIDPKLIFDRKNNRYFKKTHLNLHSFSYWPIAFSSRSLFIYPFHLSRTFLIWFISWFLISACKLFIFYVLFLNLISHTCLDLTDITIETETDWSIPDTVLCSYRNWIFYDMNCKCISVRVSFDLIWMGFISFVLFIDIRFWSSPICLILNISIICINVPII